MQDIKPANLLIDDRDRLRIADFGLSRIFEVIGSAETNAAAAAAADPPQATGLYSPQVASRWYRAPELLWGSPDYGPAVDMWAAGCVLAEMLREEPLFNVSTLLCNTYTMRTILHNCINNSGQHRHRTIGPGDSCPGHAVACHLAGIAFAARLS